MNEQVDHSSSNRLELRDISVALNYSFGTIVHNIRMDRRWERKWIQERLNDRHHVLLLASKPLLKDKTSN